MGRTPGLPYDDILAMIVDWLKERLAARGERGKLYRHLRAGEAGPRRRPIGSP